MCSLFSWSSASTALLALGVSVGIVTPTIISHPASAQVTSPTTTPTTTIASTFSDVDPNYWARPFIQALAEKNVITGFPDGTFRPNQPVERSEFAAMIQKAFNQTQVRQLSPGGFRDVPADYWAASAIESAYETGFMTGYPDNLFQPNQQIPKVQAIVALVNGLRLTASNNVSDVVSTYYTDATAIPNYAIYEVAAATQGNIVVNYPDVRVLNPLVPLTRAEAAALLYQALVKQGQVQPLASNVLATQYIVGRTTNGAQTANDIVSLAASSNSFTTLTSLLKTTGLRDTLQQQGPYTVFAPTDAAFAALPKNTLQRLLLSENRETLIKILRYHVVSGELTARELSTGEQKTLEGRPVNIQITPATSQIAVNKASVIQPNVQASNGVIHVINQVLLPPDINLAQQPQDGITPGRTTRGGSSYIGVGGNIGLGGDSALSEGNFAVFSKIGLTRTISARPSAVIGDDPIVLVPVTFDFAGRSANPFGEPTFTIAPYVGAGVAIETSDDADVGLLLTGGVDVPLSSRFTLTGAVNAAFLDETDVGLMLGVGYNF
ncbi:fasciclin domain-containing protein [Iningainema tapete]|uniref:Fasciclin domain-containing protein n=1 Tax=Iningainema tapete BLCC-T55 TaxID=2748662 RepID=A0A8J6XK23_9CYAN|nr:fasciclin domain-containing protein [Iningainema tapete]MBD2774011.1 fasciclin domain-containing protein [Iningainema tapete BLCC-T55]